MLPEKRPDRRQQAEIGRRPCLGVLHAGSESGHACPANLTAPEPATQGLRAPAGELRRFGGIQRGTPIAAGWLEGDRALQKDANEMRRSLEAERTRRRSWRTAALKPLMDPRWAYAMLTLMAAYSVFAAYILWSLFN